MSGDMEASMTTSITDADRATAHAAVFPGHFADRVELVALALAAERAKALAPLLTLADELEQHAAAHDTRASDYRSVGTHGMAARESAISSAQIDAAERIRAAAGPDRTNSE